MCAFFVSHITQRVRVFADFTADFCGCLLLFFYFVFFSLFVLCSFLCGRGSTHCHFFPPKVICMVLCISNLSYRLTYSSCYSAYTYPSCMSVPLNMIKKRVYLSPALYTPKNVMPVSAQMELFTTSGSTDTVYYKPIFIKSCVDFK